MAPSLSIFRSFLLACAVMGSAAADPARVVFQGGASIPVDALVQQAGNLVVNAEIEGFTVGQPFPIQTADHVYGDRPAQVNQGVALIMMGKPKDALKLLEPAVLRHRLTAKIPGNFWVEAARSALIAYALTGNSAKCSELGKEISDATPEAGIDPFIPLSKTLLLPESTKAEDRVVALRDLISDSSPADVCAYASFFVGNLLKENKKPTEALEAYLSVTCIYPTGGLAINAGAEVKAAEILTGLGRHEEATTLLKSALPSATGTALAEDIKKLLESTK